MLGQTAGGSEQLLVGAKYAEGSHRHVIVWGSSGSACPARLGLATAGAGVARGRPECGRTASPGSGVRLLV